MTLKEMLHTRFHYPFPGLKNPFADVLQEMTDNEWIDVIQHEYNISLDRFSQFTFSF